MKNNQSNITAADMAGDELTLRAAHRFLELNGIDWSFGWMKTQVFCGKIASEKKFNSRVVRKTELSKIIRDHKRLA